MLHEKKPRTFLHVGFRRFVLEEDVPGAFRIGVRVEDLVEARVALVPVQELDKLIDGDQLLLFFAASEPRVSHNHSIQSIADGRVFCSRYREQQQQQQQQNKEDNKQSEAKASAYRSSKIASTSWRFVNAL